MPPDRGSRRNTCPSRKTRTLSDTTLSSAPMGTFDAEGNYTPRQITERDLPSFADAIQRCAFISSGAARMLLCRHCRLILPQALW